MTDKHNKPELEQQIEALLRNVHAQISADDWPARANHLLYELGGHAAETADSSEQEVLLSLVINDALDGVEISQKYPAFFRTLLRDAQLREAFEDALELMAYDLMADDRTEFEADFIDEEQLPAVILGSSAAQKQLQKEPSSRWIAAWSLTADKLQALIDQLWGSHALAYRSVASSLESSRVTLLRKEASLDRNIEVLLEAGYEPEFPDRLSLSLWLANDSEEKQTSPDLIVELEWGDYKQQLQLREWGAISLQPLSFEDIFTPEGQLMRTPLYLKITTAT